MYLIELETAFDDSSIEVALDRLIEECRKEGHQLEAAVIHEARHHGWPSVVWTSDYKTSLMYLLVTYYDDGGDGPGRLVNTIVKTRTRHG